MEPMHAFKYNPAFWSREELLASFRVRNFDLEWIIDIIREITGPNNQQILVVGPDGVGKTTFLLRVVEEIRQSEELSNLWHPIIFAEESYKIFSPGEFWLETLFCLSRQQKGERWVKTHEELCGETNEFNLRERALGQLKKFANEQGKRLLLVVENFHMLLGQQISDDDAWKIRHTLMNDPHIMILGSATSRFEQLTNYGKAMYEFFYVYQLGPLDADDCRELHASVCGESLEGNRIRPIQILSGGSPGAVTLISHAAADSPSRDLMKNVARLVDERTEYFKRGLDALPPLERKVFSTLADLWKPSTSREVAGASRIDINKTSACLKRLCNRGLVTIVAQRGRKKWHEVADRMLNLYHLMRRAGGKSDRVAAMVRFMTCFYEYDASRTSTHPAGIGLTPSPGRQEEIWEVGDAADARYGTPDSFTYKDMVHGDWEKNIPQVKALLKKHVKTGFDLPDVIDFFIDMAASGHADQALEMLVEHSEKMELTPLVTGLTLFLGEEILAVHEIMQIGRDVARRIQERTDLGSRTK